MFWIGYAFGLLTFILLGILFYNADNILKLNRKMPWYNWYCYLISSKTSKEKIVELYKSGYITETQFKLLAKNKCSKEEINKIIEKHKELLQIIENLK